MAPFDGFLGAFDGYLRAGSALAYAAAFGAGVLASFTPCVYPLVPVTAGYIGSRAAGSRRKGFALSAAYVFGMALTYAALGTAASVLGRVFGEAASSPWAYLLVGNVCLLLALSMFDIVRLPLPSFAGGPVPRGGGLPGAFAVGMASGLVVGPCTAPVLGSLLLFVGSRRNVLFGTTLLFAFALGMGTLLLAVGTFSGFLAGLPRPGAWLERVRKLFGALLLAAAEYLFVKAGILFV